MAKKMCGEERLVVVERVHWWNHGSLVVVEGYTGGAMEA